VTPGGNRIAGPALAWALAVSVFALASTPGHAEEPCPFDYAGTAHADVVEILKSEFPTIHEAFNDRRPTITREGNRVEVLLLPLYPPDGGVILYEKIFVVAFDACSGAVIEHYEADYPASYPGDMSP
jgi:hypothetical protein